MSERPPIVRAVERFAACPFVGGQSDEFTGEIIVLCEFAQQEHLGVPKIVIVVRQTAEVGVLHVLHEAVVEMWIAIQFALTHRERGMAVGLSQSEPALGNFSIEREGHAGICHSTRDERLDRERRKLVSWRARLKFQVCDAETVLSHIIEPFALTRPSCTPPIFTECHREMVAVVLRTNRQIKMGARHDHRGRSPHAIDQRAE